VENEGGAEKLGEVLAWRDSKLFSPMERVALEYAERITTTRQKVDDALFAELVVNVADSYGFDLGLF